MPRLARYIIAAAALQLALATGAAAATAAADAAVTSELDTQTTPNSRLRGLLRHITGDVANPALASASAITEEKTPAPAREIVPTWSQSPAQKDMSTLNAVEKIVGDEAIVVFYDRSVSPEATIDSAVVTFDVRSRANCVVSVCGLQRNWYMRNEERCFDLRIAQKSLDETENGFIRGISAAFSPLRPVASKLYLKFDATNFIDEQVCEYEIVSGSKTVVTAQAAAPSGGAVALS
ncbi:hypothetical protein PybrP1_011805 [[Pythium] brassicae (nom. inval.)]|nr:hypothetical protein PybrP1_011805 [[Pythium] brassicae (nom. inval.)]